MTQKGFTPIFLLIVILVVMGFVGGGVYLSKKNASTIKACTQDSKQCADGSLVYRIGTNCEFADCPATPSADETANWKTYTNTKYGYSLKYPSSLIIEESNDPNGNVDQTMISNHSISEYSSKKINPEDSEEFIMSIGIPRTSSIRDITQAKSNYKDFYKGSLEDYTVGGEKGFRTTNGTPIIIVHNNKEYFFILSPYSIKNYKNDFYKILSTFKFIN